METERFREEQGFRQWWLWLIVGSSVVLLWWGFVQQIVIGEPWGDNPGPDWLTVLLWLAIGLGLPILFLLLKLIVTVTDEAVDIYFRPITRRTIQVSEISEVKSRTYSPLREYGGWGIRGFGSKRAYNVSGDRGVELTLTDGRIVMIGSLRPDDLARAIDDARRS